MKLLKFSRPAAFLLAALSANRAYPNAVGDLWAHDNLVAWCTVPFDAKMRGPEERAQMLEKLGFKHFAYDWRAKDIPTFDAEIGALKEHGIDLLAWWFPFDADDPQAKATLETFKRHNVHPQLWVIHSLASVSKSLNSHFPKNAEEQELHVAREANRIAALARLAEPYGCSVELYNHNGWFGMEENQLAIIERLKALGATDVGMVYNFSHARDDLHDDSKNFPQLWKTMKPHVVAVNITGMHWDGKEVYPSQGDSELAMMRTIQKSGWKGPIGLIAEKGGDAEITLGNYIIGLDWLAAELKQPGSGGPRPFPLVQ